MIVDIDSARCQGHGRCYEVAPELFGDDERGRGLVLKRDVPSEQEHSAASAVSACPERAVLLWPRSSLGEQAGVRG